MQSITTHTDIDELIGDLKEGERTIKELPHNGFLYLEHDVSALLIYRKKQDDKATERLVKSGASFLIIGDDDFEYFQRLLYKITKKMSSKFGAFMLLEIFSGAQQSSQFIIRGPSHKLPASLDVLKEELENIQSRRTHIELSTKIVETKERHPEEAEALVGINEIKARGGTLVSIEVPPIYRDDKGYVFPLYFRRFRDSFALAIKKAVFEFLRVQTATKLQTYNALGKRGIQNVLYDIDKEITAIQNSYQFLLLIAPVNIQALRQRFFESNFRDIGNYHYRLLPVDPDILKRRLYNLKIEDIDDPALSYLYDEKREEIDNELTMLKERDSKNFFYSSMRLYKGISQNVLAEANLILQNIPENTEEDEGDKITAQEFEKIAQEEFDYFKSQDATYNCKVHIRDDVNIMMVSNGELYLPSDYTMTPKDAKALTQHELGTHALTYYNGKQQSLSQMSVGFADYDTMQEGLAVLAEYFCGALSANRLRILAGRVVAGKALIDGANFKYMFNMLFSQHGFTKERAFNITSRMFQGGGFLKDVVYLKGLVQLRDYFQNGGDLKNLLAGKFALKHVDIISDLTERKLLKSPVLTPRYLNTEIFQNKMDAVRNGIALSKMI